MGEYGCNVCREEYSIRIERRTPRVLTGCGHTICQGCAQAIAQAGRSAIICPFDRVSTTIPSGDVLNLKKNFALIELMEKIANREEDPETIDRFMRERLLGVDCDEDPTHSAVFYCTVCDSNLCERCSESTHSTTVLSRHRRVLLTEKPPQAQRCSIHPSHTVEFACQEDDCESDNRLMCLLCRDYGVHKGHSHNFIEKEAELLRDKLQQSITALSHTNDDLRGWMGSINSAITVLSDDDGGPLALTRSDIVRHFESVREEINKAEQTALQTLSNHIQDRKDALSCQLHTYTQLSSKIGSTCVELQKALVGDRCDLVTRKADLIALTESAAAERVQSPEDTLLSTLIPYSLSRDNRLHLGHFVDARVVLLGLDGAGKTTLIGRLKRCEPMASPPTIGFNVETVHHKNFRLNLWDVGGLPKLRPLWKHYYTGMQALLFVIDGSAVERYAEAKRELMRVVSDPLISCPILVIINRRCVDPPDSCSMDGLVQSVSTVPAPIRIHHCDALNAIGMQEILNDLTNSLNLGYRDYLF